MRRNDSLKPFRRVEYVSLGHFCHFSCQQTVWNSRYNSAFDMYLNIWKSMEPSRVNMAGASAFLRAAPRYQPFVNHLGSRIVVVDD